MRHFKPIFGGVISITNCSNLDENTIIGTEPKCKGLTRIFGVHLEITEEEKKKLEKNEGE